MTKLPDPHAPPVAWRATLYRVPDSAGIALFLWALLWIVLSAAANLVASTVMGVTLRAGGLAPADRLALMTYAGMVGSYAVLALVARHIGPARNSYVPERGYGAIQRPLLVATAAGLLFLYIVPITLSAMSTYPEHLRKIVNASGGMAALGFILVVVVAPLAEELFFRGWLWDGLRRSWGPLGTAAITSFLWLFAHAPVGGPTRMILLIPAAIALSWVRHRCGTIRASLAVHAFNNMVVMLLPWLAAYWLGWMPWLTER